MKKKQEKSLLEKRIESIRAYPFEESVQAIAQDNGLDIPDPFPRRNIRCVLPGHADRTASLSLRPSTHPRGQGFRCFGCGKHGDAIDFVMAVEDIQNVIAGIERMEVLLGLFGDRTHQVLGLAKRRAKQPLTLWQKRTADYQANIEALELRVLATFRPYLRASDPVIVSMSETISDWLFDELRDVSSAGPPRNDRALRERLRNIHGWVRGILGGLMRDVERMTGKDVLDLEAQNPRRIPLTPRQVLIARKLLRIADPQTPE